ncbi:glycogen phosphorylase 1-like [Schistocerca gregaria]|uniref:glycogen phosphorylase 1-like n=1 Tax=Schistocerca gregaria TaxID=7010 RepID=UPI00211DCD6A|nr:glycogen phosphorylase 1-like [Schistocerca gregaria]
MAEMNASEARQLYAARRRSLEHMGDSTRNLRMSFLQAAASQERIITGDGVEAPSDVCLLEKDYPGKTERVRVHPDRPVDLEKRKDREKIFELMKSYLSQDPNDIAQFIVNHIEYTLARFRSNFDEIAAYLATAYSVRDRLIEGWNDTQMYYKAHAKKFCFYLSIEYLPGRSLQNAINNMGLQDPYHAALNILGYELEDVYDMEQDGALGNGGLGRLASCFLDSMATLGLPAWGYGLRYKYGMFKQVIQNSEQVEMPDYWLGAGNPWEIQRLGRFYQVFFYGKSVRVWKDQKLISIWEPGEVVHAHAYDNPIPGYRIRNVTNLRLWESKPATEINLSSFNSGQYEGALQQKQEAEKITSVLYPNDSTYQGRILRLKQQYFLSSATLQDIVDRFKLYMGAAPMKELANAVAIQLNDTHPTISIVEMMRILVDIEGMEWDDAWSVTTKVFSYTNHTVLPEALEKWEVNIMEEVLPRHMEIIYLINHYFMEYLEKLYPGDSGLKGRLSIIEEEPVKKVRMAYLAVIACHKVNGVSVIHSDILQNTLFREFVAIWPRKFINVTNGVTPRRWVNQANMLLSNLISKTLGSDKWLTDFELIRELKKYASDREFQKNWWECRMANKRVLCAYVLENVHIVISPDALFDIQVKRIHEYKRQLLNLFGVIHRYLWLKSLSPREREKQVSRVHFIGGKAATGYYRAKLVIKLINQVAQVINSDPEIGSLLKLVFLPNYSISMAEILVGASDLSQHISKAGTEASGTSNMKFCMNGCLLLGTWDGANIEIAEEIGVENAFIFGTRVDELPSITSYCDIDDRLWKVMNTIVSNDFGYADEFKQLVDPIRHHYDQYLVAHDFPSYLEAQKRVDDLWTNKSQWIRQSILTCAGMGKFSSDNSVTQYARKIWDIEPQILPIITDQKLNRPV